MPRIVPRDFGTSLYFNNNKVTVKSGTILSGQNAFTVSAWVKVTDPSLTRLETIYSERATAGNDILKLQVNTVTNGGNVLIVYRDDAGTLTQNGVGSNIRDGRWHWIVWTRSGSSTTVYIDGVSVYTGSVAGTNNFTNANIQSTIGYDNGGGSEYFIGFIDAVKLWNISLTAAEISRNYYTGIYPATASVGWWRFNEGSGTTAIDDTGVNNGTIIGATYSTDVAYKTRQPDTTRQVSRQFDSTLYYTGSTSSASFTLDTANWTGATFSFWFKMQPTTNLVNVFSRSATYSDFIFRINTDNTFRFAMALASSNINLSSNTSQPRYVNSTWAFGTCVYDGTTASIYLNGALVVTAPASGNLGAAQGNNWSINSGNTHMMNLGRLHIWNRGLSAAEVGNLYRTGLISQNGLQASWPMQEGSGTVVYDRTANGVNMTTTAGTSWSNDVPMKRRQVVNPNLVPNSDFEYAPPNITAVPTGTAAARWIDGTAAGSTTNDLFKWGINALNGSGNALFDNTVARTGSQSLKMSLPATASNIGASQVRAENTPALVQQYAIPVMPNTQYTMTGWIKTNYVSGDASRGAYIRFAEFSQAGTSITTTDTPYVKTTIDWTQYTLNVTTSATTRFVTISVNNRGSDGVATLIMDAWFDDIVLTPTTPVTRPLVS